MFLEKLTHLSPQDNYLFKKLKSHISTHICLIFWYLLRKQSILFYILVAVQNCLVEFFAAEFMKMDYYWRLAENPLLKNLELALNWSIDQGNL